MSWNNHSTSVKPSPSVFYVDLLYPLPLCLFLWHHAAYHPATEIVRGDGGWETSSVLAITGHTPHTDVAFYGHSWLLLYEGSMYRCILQPHTKAPIQSSYLNQMSEEEQ